MGFLCVLLGQSSVNFFFSLVEAHEGAHGDFGLQEGRPLSGQTLICTLNHQLHSLNSSWSHVLFFLFCSCQVVI